MPGTVAVERGQPVAIRKQGVVAAVIGNFVEWNEFANYATLAVVIAQLFGCSRDGYETRP
jgi:hypothetical protein